MIYFLSAILLVLVFPVYSGSSEVVLLSLDSEIWTLSLPSRDPEEVSAPDEDGWGYFVEVEDATANEEQTVGLKKDIVDMVKLGKAMLRWLGIPIDPTISTSLPRTHRHRVF